MTDPTLRPDAFFLDTLLVVAGSEPWVPDHGAPRMSAAFNA